MSLAFLPAATFSFIFLSPHPSGHALFVFSPKSCLPSKAAFTLLPLSSVFHPPALLVANLFLYPTEISTSVFSVPMQTSSLSYQLFLHLLGSPLASPSPNILCTIFNMFALLYGTFLCLQISFDLMQFAAQFTIGI